MAVYNIFFKFPVSEEKEIINGNCDYLTPEQFKQIYYEAIEKQYNLFCMTKEHKFLQNFENILSKKT